MGRPHSPASPQSLSPEAPVRRWLLPSLSLQSKHTGRGLHTRCQAGQGAVRRAGAPHSLAQENLCPSPSCRYAGLVSICTEDAPTGLNKRACIVLGDCLARGQQSAPSPSCQGCMLLQSVASRWDLSFFHPLVPSHFQSLEISWERS